MSTNATATKVGSRRHRGRSKKQLAFRKRVAALREDQRRRVCANTDRLFFWLMLLQWIAGIIVALVVSPRTWIGDTPHVHMHVYLAVVFGGIISLPPMFLAWRLPGRMETRISIAIAQAAWSCLLIHLTGGRIETNFHAFGSLAFLAFYRDWRLLILNTLIVLMDHVIRGTVWPISVYGVAVGSTYRIVEHAVWLAWINVFLIKSCKRHLAEERRSCKRQAQLEYTNGVIEERIQRRTKELATTNEQLHAEFVEHQKTQEQREHALRKLAEASRRAGMAEVATGVLHNVGNVLNSVNVSANMLLSANSCSRVSRLKKASDIVIEHESGIAEFLTQDERGRHFPTVLQQLTDDLLGEQKKRQLELTSLLSNLDHVNQVIGFQQSFAKERSAIIEEVSVRELVDEALKINQVQIYGGPFEVETHFDLQAPVRTDRHKVLQVLINLVSNARQSLIDSGRKDAGLRISAELADGTVSVRVTDNGVGVAPEHIDRIFGHGFTTKKDGHGFGLHSSALAAQGLGGSLSVQSQGAGRGATFTLTFPGVTRSKQPCKA